MKPSGKVLIATFAPDGPEKCSGLPVVRYSPEALAQELASDLVLMEHAQHHHRTSGPYRNDNPRPSNKTPTTTRNWKIGRLEECCQITECRLTE